MRTATAILAVGLLLAGCVKTRADNELSQIGGGQAVSRNSGVVMFGIERAPIDPPIFWTVDIRRLTPGTARPEAPVEGSGAANHVSYRQFGGMLARDENYAAYAVVPGDYAIVAMVPAQEGGLFVNPDFRQAGPQAAAMGGAGLIGLLVLGGGALAERSAEEARFGKRGRSPLVFVADDGTVLPEAPRFTVRAGEVAYLGEFLFGAKRYFDQRRDVGGGGNTDGKWTRVFTSPFVEHLVDETAARRNVQGLGLAGWPIRTVRPAALVEGPAYFAPYLTRDRVDWLSAGTVVSEDMVRARPASAGPAAPRAVPQTVPAVAGPGPGRLDGLSAADLRERFLAGEISAEQYRAALTARR
ncbi:MAG: hypothetical protein RLO51_13975 [Thalassobaculum sp.]|uniref:hypothetical protein n=1 Tax=Thalassobaculum sp. TaxID=2022740 RepID=UPI0032EB8E16